MAAESGKLLARIECVDDGGREIHITAELDQSVIDLYEASDMEAKAKLIDDIRCLPGAQIEYARKEIFTDNHPSSSQPSSSQPSLSQPSSSQPSSSQPSSSQLPASQLPSSQPSPSQSDPHVWSEAEVKLLLDIRFRMEDEFHSKTTHVTLWKKICAEMAHEGVKVSTAQARDKFNALKKKWRNVIDSNQTSGNARKDMKFGDRFDEIYGTRAGTRPEMTIDSMLNSTADNTDKVSISDDDQPEQPKKKVKLDDKRGKGKGKETKRGKVAEMVASMKETTEQMRQDIKDMHNQKMARMDRFLDILERR